MGTPDYISPEQALGEPLDGRSDVYSLAVTLFFLLAGRPPFHADTSIAMALMHVHDTPPLLSTIRFDITPQIDRVIAKALAKWPEDRYQTAGMFSTAFAEAVDNADNYVLTDSEAKRKAIVSSNGAKKALPFLKPIAQDKPIWKDSSKLQRIALPLFLLIAVIIGSVLSVFVVNKFVNTNHTQSTPTSSRNDYLADINAWPVESIGSTYFIQDGQYHIKNNPPLTFATAFYSSDSESKQLSNFSLTVTVSEIHAMQNGGDYYGIILRSSGDQQHYYLFEVSSSFGGQYEFLRYDGPTKKKWDTLADGHLTSLYTNFGHTNIIAVVAKSNTFTFSVNMKQLGKPIIDTSNQPLNSGDIGLSVEGQNTEVAFSHLLINKL